MTRKSTWVSFVKKTSRIIGKMQDKKVKSLYLMEHDDINLSSCVHSGVTHWVNTFYGCVWVLWIKLEKSIDYRNFLMILMIYWECITRLRARRRHMSICAQSSKIIHHWQTFCIVFHPKSSQTYFNVVLSHPFSGRNSYYVYYIHWLIWVEGCIHVYATAI